MTNGITIALGTIGPSIVAWIAYREFRNRDWLPTYILLAVLGLVWGLIATYNNMNHTQLGSLPRAVGHVVTGVICGVVIAMALNHRKTGKRE